MLRVRSLLGRSLAGVALLLVAGCVGPPTPALFRPPDLPADVGLHEEASVGLGARGMAPAAGIVPVPDVRVGVRRAFAVHLNAGLSLSLQSGLQLDALVDLFRGPVWSVSLDPRVSLGSNAPYAAAFGTGTVQTQVSATLPVTVGRHLGPDELVLGPLASAFWYDGANQLFYVWVGGGVGLEVPVGPAHLLPEVDVSCVVNGGPCAGYLMLSLR